MLETFASIFNTVAGNQARKREANIAHQRNIELWNMQNQYNSPQAQMQRLQAAGLNPNMVYGTGVQAAGQADAPARYQAPQQDFNIRMPNIADEIQKFQQIDINNAQIDRIKSMTRNMDERTANTIIERDLLGQKKVLNEQRRLFNIIDLEKGAIDLKYYDRKQHFTVQDLEQAARLKFSNRQLNAAQIANLRQTRKLIRQQTINLKRDFNIKGYEKQWLRWRNDMFNDIGMTFTDDQVSRMTYTMMRNNGQDPYNTIMATKIAQAVVGALRLVGLRGLGGKISTGKGIPARGKAKSVTGKK